MAKKNELLKIGDIVEIVEDGHDGLGLRGKVREVGPPLVVAFTYLEPLKAKQVNKVDTPSTLTWNELRARAVAAGIPAAGKRDELEASVEAHIEAASAPTVPATATRGSSAANEFPVGAIVQINDPGDKLRHKCRGKVIDGPSVTVQLTNKDFEVEVKRYPKSKLIRVG